MGVDGMVTDGEFFANLFTCLSRSEFLQNIKLAVCDISKNWFFRAVGIRKIIPSKPLSCEILIVSLIGNTSLFPRMTILPRNNDGLPA